jgi:catechol 1,2-dioxygenase
MTDNYRRRLKRREFLQLAAIGTAAAIAPGIASAQSAGSSAGSLALTPAQVEGPYFLPNSPFRDVLFPQGMTGDQIKISGRVLSRDGSAIAGATVHVWLADPKGAYDNQDAQGDPVSIPPSKQTLRGRIVADADGKYAFTCLRPGNYSLGNGRVRPAHIHVRVEADGYHTLVTQLYFVDDKFNTKDLPGEGFFKPALLVPLTPVQAQSGVVQQGTFDFVIGK